MDNSAIVPENLSLDAEPIQETEQQAITTATEEDKELGALLTFKGYQRQATKMRADIERFRTGGFIKNIENKSLEEIGKLFVIHQTVASLLQGYLDDVEQAAKAVADAERAK